MAWSEGDDGGNSTRTEGYYPLPFPEEISQTNWITNQALSFIDETPVDQPLYTHISYVQPHPQFHPPERFLERVNDDLIPDPVGYGTDHWNRPDKLPNWRYYRKLYFADFIHIDDVCMALGFVADNASFRIALEVDCECDPGARNVRVFKPTAGH